jgi:hypothetical protein
MKIVLIAALALLIASPAFAAGHAASGHATASRSQPNNQTIQRPASTCDGGLTICRQR